MLFFVYCDSECVQLFFVVDVVMCSTNVLYEDKSINCRENVFCHRFSKYFVTFAQSFLSHYSERLTDSPIVSKFNHFLLDLR